MDTIYSFGYWVRRRRKALDMTQRELADAAGCALVTLKKIETDRRRPSLEMAARLAECLAVPEVEMPVFLAAARGRRPVDTLEAPLSPSPAIPRDVIPAAATPLIGREPEIATALAVLASPDTRLVTLVGPGGIGKTRMALATAAAFQQVQPRPFASGIVFIDLSAVTDGPRMVPAIAAALGFEPDTRGRDPRPQLEQLAGYLRPRDTLLILDNLEQLDGARRVIDELLRATPAVKILATSRERLDLPWEHLLALPGLAYSSETEADPADFPAGRLFLARARRLRPDFIPGPADRRALAALCALVDGMPLALELAAAWIDTLTLPEIAAELRHDLGLPGEARDDLPERHRSLRGVWDSAWQRLDEANRAAFAQLCVFRGGFTRAAAESVAGITVGKLGRLTGRYLITLDREAGRYRIHELLRQYGYANLMETGAATKARQRHFDYFLAFTETQATRIHGPEQQAALRRIAAETDNLTAALNWGLSESNRVEKTIRLMSALHWYWRIHSRVTEASDWTERALAAIAPSPVGADLDGRPLPPPAPTGESLISPAAEAQLLFEAGHFAWMRGEFALARDRHLAALDRWQAAGRGDTLPAAITTQHLAMSYGQLDDPATAAPLFAAALDRYRELGAIWFETFILPQVAQNRQALGDRPGADRAAADHLRLVARLGDPWLTGLGRLNLGDLAWHEGDLERARQLISEGLAAQRATGHTHSVGAALTMLAEIALQEGHLEAASGYFGEALALYEGMGHDRYAADTRQALAEVGEG